MMLKKVFPMIFCMIIIFAMSVSAADNIAVTGIKITINKTELFVGDSTVLSASVAPFNAEDYSLRYTSDNPEVAIAAVGTIIAKSPGTANITVSVNNTSISDTVTVTVKSRDDEPEEIIEDIPVTKIIPADKVIYMEQYDETEIEYDIYPQNASKENVLFESSNTSIVTVDKNGVLYAKRTGSARITIFTEGKKVSNIVTVYVENSYDDDDYYSLLRKIDITYEDKVVTKVLDVMCTTDVKLGIKTVPELANKNVKWRSSDSRIATVTSSGVVTGVKIGTCKIYAVSTSNRAKTDVIEVNVTEYKKYPEKIILSLDINSVLETGKGIYINAEIYPENTTERELRYYVIGNGASISQNGLLYVTQKGMITVKAYAADGKTFGEYSCEIKYADNHFKLIKEDYNVSKTKNIILKFDKEISNYQAQKCIFVGREESGNQDYEDIRISVEGNRIIISPVTSWKSGDNYIFITGELFDTSYQKLGENLKYKFKVRDM